MSRMKVRYIEYCTTPDCRVKRPTHEKSKSGFVCYRCNRKKSRVGKQKTA